MHAITINFANVTLTSPVTMITVSNGEFALTANDGVSISGPMSFEALYLTSNAINVNAGAGATFNATVQAVVNMTSGAAPVLQVTNFQGMVMATWPTPTGMQTQRLEPGNPLTLSGFMD